MQKTVSPLWMQKNVWDVSCASWSVRQAQLQLERESRKGNKSMHKKNKK